MAEKKSELMKMYNLTESMLQQRVSGDHMFEIMRFVSWKLVGLSLRSISVRDIDDIECEYRTQTEKRWKLIRLWEERNGSDATYDVMITAMVRAGTHDEAIRVCKMLGDSNLAPVPPKPHSPSMSLLSLPSISGPQILSPFHFRVFVWGKGPE